MCMFRGMHSTAYQSAYKMCLWFDVTSNDENCSCHVYQNNHNYSPILLSQGLLIKATSKPQLGFC